MLSYQHAYHAGNLADVHKHALLCALLDDLTKKPQPLLYTETHSGRGLYYLNAQEAQKTKEANAGILHLQRTKKIPKKGIYNITLQKIRSMHGPQAYPGSPFIAHAFKRADDALHLCELHPQEFKALEKNMPKAKVHLYHKDGLGQAEVLFQPQEGKTDLLFIDPSYEIKTEYAAIATFVNKMHRQNPKGLIMLWYPILAMRLHQEMVESIQKHSNHALKHEVTFPVLGHHRLKGSGLFFINPPQNFKKQIQAVHAFF